MVLTLVDALLLEDFTSFSLIRNEFLGWEYLLFLLFLLS